MGYSGVGRQDFQILGSDIVESFPFEYHGEGTTGNFVIVEFIHHHHPITDEDHCEHDGVIKGTISRMYCKNCGMCCGRKQIDRYEWHGYYKYKNYMIPCGNTSYCWFVGTCIIDPSNDMVTIKSFDDSVKIIPIKDIEGLKILEEQK